MKIVEIIEEIEEEKECYSLKELAINGSDLIELGIKEGKQIGKILKQLLGLVIKEPNLNSRERLLKWVIDEVIKKQTN